MACSRTLLLILAGLLSFAAAQVASCNGNADCDNGSFCRRPVGNCGGEGTCEVKPEMCTEDIDYVCGCNGKTFDNDCKAEMAGASLRSEEKCKDDGGAVAAVTCTGNDVCAEGSFCQQDMGDCGGEGTCVEKPEMCTEEYNPMCGCDGTTHDNPCYARMAGATVASKGECKDDGGAEATTVSCTGNGDCPKESFCHRKEGGCGGEGTCEVKPEMCTEDIDYVCGCDGTTYDNGCKAESAGATVETKGECDKSVEISGGSNVTALVNETTAPTAAPDAPTAAPDAPTAAPDDSGAAAGGALAAALAVVAGTLALA